VVAIVGRLLSVMCLALDVGGDVVGGCTGGCGGWRGSAALKGCAGVGGEAKSYRTAVFVFVVHVWAVVAVNDQVCFRFEFLLMSNFSRCLQDSQGDSTVPGCVKQGRDLVVGEDVPLDHVGDLVGRPIGAEADLAFVDLYVSGVGSVEYGEGP